MASTTIPPPIIIGAGKFGSSIADAATVQAFIDLGVEHGASAVDTARVYGGGKSEELIGTGLTLHTLSLDTKLFPANKGLSADNIRAQVAASRAALGGKKIRVLYWHAPDRATPFEESLKVMDEFWKEGVFEEFGLSNAFAYEVAEIVTICRERGWVKPTVYQGIYNALDRVVEDELFPCLRKFGIRFAAYSPLAGGVLTGFHLDDPARLDANARFNPSNPGASDFFRPRYAHSTPTLLRVRALAEKHGLTLAECGVRWLAYHSLLRSDDHGIIYGASTVEMLKTSLVNHAKGRLPAEIVEELEESWKKELKGWVPTYSVSA